jgi:hypothetical protein
VDIINDIRARDDKQIVIALEQATVVLVALPSEVSFFQLELLNTSADFTVDESDFV